MILRTDGPWQEETRKESQMIPKRRPEPYNRFIDPELPISDVGLISPDQELWITSAVVLVQWMRRRERQHEWIVTILYIIDMIPVL